MSAPVERSAAEMAGIIVALGRDPSHEGLIDALGVIAVAALDLAHREATLDGEPMDTARFARMIERMGLAFAEIVRVSDAYCTWVEEAAQSVAAARQAKADLDSVHLSDGKNGAA
jgi:hypothetical protein